MKTLWTRLHRGECNYARRLKQLSTTNAALAARGWLTHIQSPIYTPLASGNHPRFATYSEARKRRSEHLVAAAILSLRDNGQREFPLPAIVAATRALDPEGKGVSLSVLYQNGVCANLVARANRSHFGSNDAIPPAARRLGRKGLIARVTAVEKALAEVTVNLMQANERLFALETDEFREATTASQLMNSEMPAYPTMAPSGSSPSHTG